MAGFFDFLTAIFTPKDKKDTSVVVKNYINGNNNQNNGSGTTKQGKERTTIPQRGKPPTTPTNSNSILEVQSVRLYSTGAKGKVYTNKFYKAINHNFGIEVVIKNNTSKTQTVSLGFCIYYKSTTIIHGDFHPKIAPHSTLTQDIYVKPEVFAKMKSGEYKAQLWLNDKKVKKVYFTVINK